jgi:hypothetical protein
VAWSSGYTADGTVYCNSGAPVEGVWVNDGSASGWASWSSWTTGEASFGKYVGWHPYFSITVGCGGSPQRWATSNTSGSMLAGLADWYFYCGDGHCSVVGLDG